MTAMGMIRLAPLAFVVGAGQPGFSPDGIMPAGIVGIGNGNGLSVCVAGAVAAGVVGAGFWYVPVGYCCVVGQPVCCG